VTKVEVVIVGEGKKTGNKRVDVVARTQNKFAINQIEKRIK
jgi:hypothetical protein